MTTTKISIKLPAETTDSPTISIYHPTPFQHALIIDLGDFEDQPDESDDDGLDLDEEEIENDHERTEGWLVPETGDSSRSPAGTTLEQDLSRPSAQDRVLQADFVSRLESIVEKDGQGHPPIDMVRFLKTNSREWPSSRTWKALDGLRPRHLEVRCGNMEDCDLMPLNALDTLWPLESLLLAGYCDFFEYGGHDKPHTPNACASVITLVLDVCHSVMLAPPGGCHALRHVSIIENNAVDMFAMTMRKNPGVAAKLETLKLHHVGYGLGDEFISILKQCTGLQSLDLTLKYPESPVDSDDEDMSDGDDSLGDLDEGGLEEKTSGTITGIAPDSAVPSNPLEAFWAKVNEGLPSFPNDLQHLRFNGPPAMVSELPIWLECIGNTAWLPHLKSVAFQLSGIRPYKPKLTPESLISIASAAPQAETVLEAFRKHRPGVQIVSAVD